MTKLFWFLRRDQPLELYFYAVPQLCLRTMGYWPSPKTPMKRPWRAYINFMVLGIGVMTELHAGAMFARSNQLSLAIETFCPAYTSFVTLLKMFLMLHYRHDLHYVVDQQRELLFGHEIAAETHEIIRKNSLMATRFNFWPFSAGFSTSSMYNLKPLLLALVLHLQRRNDEIVWGLPFNHTMPSFLLSWPYLPVMFIFSAYTGYITIFMFGGCDAFYFEFCVHIGTLFKSLQVDTRALFKPYEDLLQIDGVHAARFEAALVELIKRQNRIIDLTHFFGERYWIITLLHFVSASMVIAVSIFNLMTVGGNGFGTLLYVSYTIAALSQLLIYCYGGTLVAESSMELAVVMGSCPWHRCLPRHRRYVHMFILRSQRALSMSVPFFSPSLVTFGAILQTSGSIIALAKSFQ
ncbi:odorant receptor 10a [Drosophila nasuta]|uniref:odorant receptor 10a n=1 Tax=Drosophila nasuta TaxID=42062 RepID=UPI00295E67D3|nr:odorant receptor 10a [Drosophila nasuta]